jgi:hypothetical protein
MTSAQTLRAVGPVLRPVMRSVLAGQRRWKHRGWFAHPWIMIVQNYGPDVLAHNKFDQAYGRTAHDQS